MATRIIAVSDFCDPTPPTPTSPAPDAARAFWRATPLPHPGPRPDVVGGYLERLPLACVAAGLVDSAEVWRFAGDDARHDPVGVKGPEGLIYRTLRADGHSAPYGSVDALAHIAVHGAPKILCVWGLGVNEALLEACADSVIVYNSIDAPALRLPPEVSRHVDLFLTGAEWQSDEIRARHPDALCAVLPIGPDFASDRTFFPTGAAKDYDVVYVAATQPYKRHDLLLDALARLPGRRALCVVGYGHMTGDLRAEGERRGLQIDWVGPVDHGEVNRLINRAKVGVVCGVDDGAPAILTEYMLAGLPVLANAGLVCGRQYIRPDTGRVASEAEFAQVLGELIDSAHTYDPRPVVQRNWTWPHSVKKLADLLDHARQRKKEVYA
ncbi:glycosyltransferase [Falsirhodobacter sp. 20TX0035]|uniref:glycosyltransferase n=1 Tax=Falsirhodobacter sp. 20TX0035 TaxID=3022019 RepID=UPI0023304AF9|nr:glycosyltransferase [Falsirhodobacter sp. 20TX0035]MDB6452900.1 glycosyltransferase [Falsirhodobacter sp. 20TX0035]